MSKGDWLIKLNVGSLVITYSGEGFPSDDLDDEQTKRRLEFVEMVTALFQGQTSFVGLQE